MGARCTGLSDGRKFCRGREFSSARIVHLRRRWTPAPDVWRRLGMDPQRLLALPRVSRGTGRTWRIQRQVHVQPVRFAWRFVCNVTYSYSPHLSQFLPTRKTLAVYRDQTGPRSTINPQGATRRRPPNDIVIMTADQLTAMQPAPTVPPAIPDLLSDVIAGLSSDPRTLPCKYFYDEQGAALFQKICELPEYYVTRTEIDILDRRRAEIASQLGPNIELIGLGTGAGTKTRVLVEALEKPAVYIPVDISEKQLRKSAAVFRKIFPKLEVLPVCADYLQPVALPSPHHRALRNVVYFPGSTIGNFEPNEALEFLLRIANVAGRGGGLLIGVDLQKDQ